MWRQLGGPETHRGRGRPGGHGQSNSLNSLVSLVLRMLLAFSVVLGD